MSHRFYEQILTMTSAYRCQVFYYIFHFGHVPLCRHRDICCLVQLVKYPIFQMFSGFSFHLYCLQRQCDEVRQQLAGTEALKGSPDEFSLRVDVSHAILCQALVHAVEEGSQ